MSQTLFDQLKAEIDKGGVESTLDQLAAQLLEDKRYHELFDVKRMQIQHRLGLPIILSGPIEELDTQTQTKLEDAYLEICRDVGYRLLEDGKVREAWMYLRPTGDVEPVGAKLAEMTPDDDNLEELIEVSLNEGVDPARGFQLVLENYGTCNAITTFEADVSGRSPDVQRKAVALLARHLRDELVENVSADIAQRSGQPPPEESLAELVADRDWLFGEHNYHVDTTHLSSVVRFCERVEDESTWRIAVDLCEYGRRLSDEFAVEADPPFEDYYESHRKLFCALLGENVDQSLEWFREQAEKVDVEYQGAMAIEVYVKLLAHAGRYEEAIDATIRLIDPTAGIPLSGFAPSLIELSRSAGSYDKLMEASEQRGDLLSFVAGLVENRLGESASGP